MNYKIISILLVLLSATVFAQSAKTDLSLVPRPNDIKKNQGTFSFNQKTIIYLDQKDTKARTFLREYLNSHRGYLNTLPIPKGGL